MQVAAKQNDCKCVGRSRGNTHHGLVMERFRKAALKGANLELRKNQRIKFPEL